MPVMFGAMFASLFIIAIAGFIAFIWALIDIIKAKNETNWKLLWVVICLFLGVIGVIIYYFVGRKDRKA